MTSTTDAVKPGAMAFIVFEGLDGSGKSTLIQNFKQYLESRMSQSVILTHEPGGTALGEEIRNLLLRVEGEDPTPLTELLLYQASRAQNVETVIRPALSKNHWVLCDRYTASSRAFQGAGRGIDEELVESLNHIATNGLQPDVWVLLDLSLEESLRRRESREDCGGKNQDRFELEEQNFHKKVRGQFLRLAEEDSSSWVVLNAEESPEKVFQKLLKELQGRGVLKP